MIRRNLDASLFEYECSALSESSREEAAFVNNVGSRTEFAIFELILTSVD